MKTLRLMTEVGAKMVLDFGVQVMKDESPERFRGTAGEVERFIASWEAWDGAVQGVTPLAAERVRLYRVLGAAGFVGVGSKDVALALLAFTLDATPTSARLILYTVAYAANKTSVERRAEILTSLRTVVAALRHEGDSTRALINVLDSLEADLGRNRMWR